jgi:IS5 family transposase
LADQPPGQRKKDKDLTKPVNLPKGIDRALVKEHGKPMSEGQDDTVDPHRRDIRPEDVFYPKPNQIGVLNLAQTGKDLAKAIEKKVPKDKGYDTVKNLSQYLIETGGGGGTEPVE